MTGHDRERRRARSRCASLRGLRRAPDMPRRRFRAPGRHAESCLAGGRSRLLEAYTARASHWCFGFTNLVKEPRMPRSRILPAYLIVIACIDLFACGTDGSPMATGDDTSADDRGLAEQP